MKPPALIPHPDLPGALLVPLTRGYSAIIDEADGPFVGAFIWHTLFDPRRRTQYAATHYPRENGRAITTKLHKVLWLHWGKPPARLLDHADGNGLDCRRSNLRPATGSQNAANRRKARTNTSGYKGVFWHSARQKWEARIELGGGKEKQLGSFSDPREAAAAYEAAVRELHGEFARLE